MRPRCPLALTLLGLVVLLSQPATAETLRYRIRAGFVDVGTATLAIGPAAEPGVLQIRLTARSRGILDTLYPIRDRITSRVRVDDLSTVGLDRHIREGTRRINDRWIIDSARGEARERSGKRTEVDVPVHDILSVLWRLCADAPAPGDTLEHRLFMGPGLATMTTAAGPWAAVEVPAGHFTCVAVYPSLQGRPRVDPDADVQVEISRGERRLPVRIRLRLPLIGHATAELTEIAP